jgi:hypothetical protein
MFLTRICCLPLLKAILISLRNVSFGVGVVIFRILEAFLISVVIIFFVYKKIYKKRIHVY